MTRFVIDAATAIELASSGFDVPDQHELLAPTLLRSQVPSALHEAVRRGELDAVRGWEFHDRITRMPIRLLGDAVLRRVAWKVAERMGWTSTCDAEYVALTQGRGDAFITQDAELARQLDGVVSVAQIDALR